MTNPQSVTGTAPVNAPLVVPCGEDFVVEVVYTSGGDPVAVSDPQMQVRDSPNTTGTLVLTPSCSASSNTVTVRFTAAQTSAVTATTAYYDLFATRADTSAVVKLAYGQITFPPNITTPTA